MVFKQRKQTATMKRKELSREGKSWGGFGVARSAGVHQGGSSGDGESFWGPEKLAASQMSLGPQFS